MNDDTEFLSKLFDAARSEGAPAGTRARALARLGGVALATASTASVGVAKVSLSTALAWASVAAVVGGLGIGGVYAFRRHDPPATIVTGSESVREEARESKLPAPSTRAVDFVAPTEPASAAAALVPSANQCQSVPLADMKPTVCSTTGEPVLVELVNNCSDDAVDLYWVNYQCKEIFYHQLAIGETYIQSTYTTHPWRVRAHATHKLVKEVGVSGPTVPEAGTRAVVKKEITLGPTDEVPEPDVRGKLQCSEAGFGAEITVVNERSGDVEVYWLDYDCKEVFKGRLPPGDRWTQRTQDAHRFRARDATTHKLVKEFVVNPNAGAQRIYVSVP